MKIKVKLLDRAGKRTKKGYPIIVYASHNYQDRDWRTGYYAERNQWNPKLSKPTSKHPDYYMILDYLILLRDRISEVLLESTKRNLSFEEVKDWIFNVDKDSFYDSAMNSFPNNYRGTEWSAIRRFNKFYPYSTFNNVSQDITRMFRDELLKQGNKPSGVDSYIRSLKSLWNKLSDKPNPFKGVKTTIPDSLKTVASTEDIQKLHRASFKREDGFSGHYHYRNYWLLMFYLGGIDPEVLAKLRYDRNVVNGRIVFNRNKGNSNTSCSNVILTPAKEILKIYKTTESPYLVPIHLATNYRTFTGNFSRRMRELSRKLSLSVELRPKSARYTFIDRAQQLLVDERVTAQIVGHKRRTTTSIYTNDFPLRFQDEAHLKITNVKF